MHHTRKDISCKGLRGMYTKDGLSIPKISKILGFSTRTIQIRINECKIKLRKPGVSPPKVSDDVLINLYVNKKYSSRKIAKIYNCSYSYIDTRIKKLNIPRRNLSSAHIVTQRVNFSGSDSEKAYLIGFRIGDLRVRKMYKNSETILIDCGSTKPNQIKLIKNLFKKYGRVWISKPKKGYKVQIECSLNNSFSFMLEKFDKFPDWTLTDNELFKNIIAGFIDAEGSFFISHVNNQAFFSLGNYNKNILNQVKSWLDKSSFKSKIFKGVKKGYKGKDGYPHSADYWILGINRKKDLYQFTSAIVPYLKHLDRIKCAKQVLKNIDDRNLKYGFLGM